MSSQLVYQADCEQSDDSMTGFYSTPDEAINAFWNENIFSDREKAYISVYTRAYISEHPEVKDQAKELAERGIASPGLGIEATR